MDSVDDEINRKANIIVNARKERDPNLLYPEELLIQQYVQWLMRNRVPFDTHDGVHDQEIGRVWESFRCDDDTYYNCWKLTVTHDGQHQIERFRMDYDEDIVYGGEVLDRALITDAIAERVAKAQIPWSSEYDVELATKRALYARTPAAKARVAETIRQEDAAVNAARTKSIDALVSQFFTWVRDNNVPYNHKRLRPGAKPGFWSEKYKERDYERLVLLGSRDLKSEYGWRVYVTENGTRRVHKTSLLEERDVKRAIKEMVNKTGIPWPHGNLD